MCLFIHAKVESRSKPTSGPNAAYSASLTHKRAAKSASFGGRAGASTNHQAPSLEPPEPIADLQVLAAEQATVEV